MLKRTPSRLRIRDYSLSQSTLEQIFLAMARKQEQEGGSGEGATAVLLASQSPVLQGQQRRSQEALMSDMTLN